MRTDSTEVLLFRHLVNRGDGFVDLASAALLIGEVEYEERSTQECLQTLDGWAARIREHAGVGASPSSVFAALRHILFDELNVCGDDDDYYDFRNAFLSDVIQRRLGIPLSLTVLVMVMADRVDLKLEVIGHSGNYFVCFKTSDHRIVIDPDDRGSEVEDDELSEIFGKDKCEWEGDVICDRQLIRRLLTHLALLYGRSGQCRKHLEVVERLLILDRGTNHMLIGLRDHLRKTIALDEQGPLS